jgi:hypothetical protein
MISRQGSPNWSGPLAIQARRNSAQSGEQVEDREAVRRQPCVIGWKHPSKGRDPAVRVIERRLRTLEERFVPRQRTESPPTAILRERRRRRAEAEGRVYVEPDKPRVDTRGMTLTQILRLRYKDREARSNHDASIGGMNPAESAKAPAKA